MKKCLVCNVEKRLIDFYRDVSKKDGVYSCCKKCSNARRGAYRKRVGFYKSENCRARKAVEIAVRNGVLQKMPCIECNDDKVHAHHHLGYERENWLNVQWLCLEHHHIKHKGQHHIKHKGQLVHGTQHGYRMWNCRCEPCREWKSVQNKKYYKYVKKGDWLNSPVL